MEESTDKLMWDGFGFPMVIIGPKWRTNAQGYTILDIDIQMLSEAVRDALLLQPYPLTGKQVTFLRKHFEMTLEEFGKLVEKSHAGVKYWEGKNNSPAGMDVNAELLLRLRLAKKVHNTLFQRVLEEIVIPGCTTSGEHTLEIQAPSAA